MSPTMKWHETCGLSCSSSPCQPHCSLPLKTVAMGVVFPNRHGLLLPRIACGIWPGSKDRSRRDGKHGCGSSGRVPVCQMMSDWGKRHCPGKWSVERSGFRRFRSTYQQNQKENRERHSWPWLEPHQHKQAKVMEWIGIVCSRWGPEHLTPYKRNRQSHNQGEANNHQNKKNKNTSTKSSRTSTTGQQLL